MHGDNRPLPHLRRDLLIFLGAIIAYGFKVVLADLFPEAAGFLAFFLGFPAVGLIIVFLVGYVVFYPFVHLVNHYEGPSQTAWIIWLVVDTIGPTFGIPRILYYVLVILPGRRAWQSPSERIAARAQEA